MEFTFSIKDGALVAIYDDALADFLKVGQGVSIQRASQVEPTPDGKWTADMSLAIQQFNIECDNPILGPYDLREQALEAERSWLKERIFGLENKGETEWQKQTSPAT